MPPKRRNPVIVSDDSDDPSYSDDSSEVSDTDSNSVIIEIDSEPSSDNPSPSDSPAPVRRSKRTRKEPNSRQLRQKVAKKLGMQPEAIRELENKLKEVMCKVHSDEPSIDEILDSRFSLADKTDLLLWYEIYKTSEPMSILWYELRKKVIYKYKALDAKYSKYTMQEIQHLTERKKSLGLSKTCHELKLRILGMEAEDKTVKTIYQKYKLMKRSTDEEKVKYEQWLHTALAVPYTAIKLYPFPLTQTNRFLLKVKDRLDAEFYGMRKVKDQFLEFLNIRITNPRAKRCNLGLIGPPGTGKTKLAQIMAEVLDFPFEEIKMGGLDDVSMLKGDRSVYIGAEPGMIVRALIRWGVKNGVLLFDELEKYASSSISSALLQILNPDQKFHDKYLEGIDIDLSQIWMVYSMNTLPEDDALRNRLHCITMDGYSLPEKIIIARDHVLRKALENIGKSPGDIDIPEGAMRYLINTKTDTNDSGMRSIERIVYGLVNRIHLLNTVNCPNKFDFSFEWAKRIRYPVRVSVEMIDKLAGCNADISVSMQNMFI